jgi:hypothetical protein
MITLLIIPQLKATQSQTLKALFFTLAMDTVIFLSCFI